MPDRVQWFRIEKLREMGSNGYRSAHNPPAPELLDACDKLGMMVWDETRRFDDSPLGLAELEAMVRRDRNHPSIILWSIGNEEPLQADAKAGVRIATSMQNLVHRLDPLRPVTYANNGSNSWGRAVSAMIDIMGFNYSNGDQPDRYHSSLQAKPCVGSEDAVTRSTRGVYADDAKACFVSSYCDNKQTSRDTAEHYWKYFLARPWIAGVFIWTGFDYRGEPVPYRERAYTNQDGILDTCGFPKDNFYYHQACWTDKPMVHLLPHWNWAGKEGQEIDVRCYHNSESRLPDKVLHWIPRADHVLKIQLRKLAYVQGNYSTEGCSPHLYDDEIEFHSEIVHRCGIVPFSSRKLRPAVAGESKESAVFVAPSPEMVDVSHGPGMPFGGIGTGFSTFGKYGFVDVYFDGRALNGSDWRIDRAPRDKPSFAFQLTEGDKSTVLQETSVGWLTSAKPVDKVRAYADLPKGHFVFEKADSNLTLVATAFSPMVPHDLTNSTIPVQVFDVTVENKADKDRAFELALLHRDGLVVRNNKAVLVNSGGETAFACDHGVASTHGVTASLKLPPGKRQTVRFFIAWNYPSVRTTSSAARQTYRRYYTKRFQNAEQVIDLAMKSASDWSAAIDRWHAAFDVPPA